MPTISGSLKTVIGQPAAVQEVWLRSLQTTALDGGDIIVRDNARVEVMKGRLNAEIMPGAGFLIPVYAGTPGEPIPIVVRPDSRTLAEIVSDGKTFTAKNIDRIGVLAEDARKAVQASLDAISASERAATSEKNARASAQAASISESSAETALSKLIQAVTQWKPKADQLTKWEPQYEWLHANFSGLSTTVRSIMTDSVGALRAEVSGLIQQAERQANTAGQHALRADAAAKNAERAASNAVATAIDKLKGNAPEMFDTLGEIAEWVKTGGNLESGLLQSIANKAPLSDFNELKNKVSRLDISGISGLSQALAGKVSTSDSRLSDARTPRAHTHSADDISGLSKMVFEREHTHQGVTWIRRGGTAWVLCESVNRRIINDLRCPDWCRPPVEITEGMISPSNQKITVKTDGVLETTQKYIYDDVSFLVSYPVK